MRAIRAANFPDFRMLPSSFSSHGLTADTGIHGHEAVAPLA